MAEFKVSKTDLFEKQIILVYIYSKTDTENISEKQLDDVILKSFQK
mgnify:CR=1 FL=1